MSISVTCKDLKKAYGENIVIPDLSLTIREREFFTLLGPSGCGKTTLLRMMIGFNSIENGTISFNDRVMNEVPVATRNIGMVFQNYAIFPHMSTFDNVAFGLKNRKVGKAEIVQRVDAILKTVHIEELRDRMPDKMSGGQQQRIALARAIVIKPDLLLMDEPLSNLDAKLRVETRAAIKEIQNSTGITTVYVTHDQEEALAISDRVAVMDKGIIQHVGTPRAIYSRPANQFVATFIGRSNLIKAELCPTAEGMAVKFADGFVAALDTWNEDNMKSLPAGTPVLVSVRPEEFVVKSEGEGIRGTVYSKVFLGASTHYVIETSFGQRVEIIHTSDWKAEFSKGDTVILDFVRHTVNVFDSAGNRNLLQGVQNDDR
jgi:iron(III) transport system ATP-binding protein